MILQPDTPWRGDRVELFLLEPARVSEAYVGWLRDPEVTRYLESRFNEHNLASTQAFVAGALAAPDVLLLGITALAPGRHVGNIKLGPIDRHHGLADVGLMIGDRSAWGRGIATDAISVVTGIAARQLGLRKLVAGCYASNVASRRAFEKAGYHVESTRKGHCLLDGRAEDVLLLAHFMDRERLQAVAR